MNKSLVKLATFALTGMTLASCSNKNKAVDWEAYEQNAFNQAKIALAQGTDHKNIPDYIWDEAVRDTNIRSIERHVDSQGVGDINATRENLERLPANATELLLNVAKTKEHGTTIRVDKDKNHNLVMEVGKHKGWLDPTDLTQEGSFQITWQGDYGQAYPIDAVIDGKHIKENDLGGAIKQLEAKYHRLAFAEDLQAKGSADFQIAANRPGTK